MLRYVDGPILLSQGTLAFKVKLCRWHHTAKLVLMRLTKTCLSHVVQNCLLEVNVKGLARNIAAFIKRVNFSLRRISASRWHVVLWTENALQLWIVALFWIEIKLTDYDVLELFGWPPLVRCLLEEWSSSESNFFLHFIDIGLTRHPEWHI